MFLETKCPDFFDTRKIIEGVRNSDFLVSDDKCVHRIVGLKYDSQTMPEPVVTVICVRRVGQAIMERDYTAVCKVYVDYLLSVDKTW